MTTTIHQKIARAETIRRRFSKLLREEYGLTYEQALYLIAIGEGCDRPHKMRAYVGFGLSQSVTTYVDKFVALGWAERDHSPPDGEDRRATFVRLTRVGEQVYRRVRQRLADFDREAAFA